MDGSPHSALTDLVVHFYQVGVTAATLPNRLVTAVRSWVQRGEDPAEIPQDGRHGDAGLDQQREDLGADLRAELADGVRTRRGQSAQRDDR
jgi:hypothetical protein